MQDLIPDRTGFATYTVTDFCLHSGVLCLPSPNFQPTLLNKPTIQDRLGLLNTHSAKPFSPPPDFLRNFSNPYSHSEVYKVCPKTESPPLAAPSTISSSDIDCASHLLQTLEVIRPPGPPQNVGRFPTSPFNHRYRSGKTGK